MGLAEASPLPAAPERGPPPPAPAPGARHPVQQPACERAQQSLTIKTPTKTPQLLNRSLPGYQATQSMFASCVFSSRRKASNPGQGAASLQALQDAHCEGHRSPMGWHSRGTGLPSPNSAQLPPNTAGPCSSDVQGSESWDTKKKKKNHH